MAITQESLANANFNALGMDEMTRDMTKVISAVNASNLDEMVYTEVSVSSAQIKAMGTTPVELLAAPASNKYYDIDKVALEYTHVTTNYTMGTTTSLIIGTTDNGYYGAWVSTLLLNNGASSFMVTDYPTANPNAVPATVEVEIIGTPQAVYLSTDDSADPTLGDGTLLVKIWYKVRTFGTEL